MNTRYYEICNVTEVNAVSEKYVPENMQRAGSHTRVSVLAGQGAYLADHGFRMIDRSIEVKVPLQKGQTDFEKKLRMEIRKGACPKEKLFTLAQRNFREDSRFYLTNGSDRETIAQRIMKIWVDEIEEPFICIYKDTVIGFADVRFLEEYEGNPFVYLAAVDEKYRLTGAAISLYAFICAYYKRKDCRYLYGRISSRNTAVMNLYVSLGGQFMNPWDVYVR